MAKRFFKGLSLKELIILKVIIKYKLQKLGQSKIDDDKLSNKSE
jgi:hypothetical protein